MAYIRLAKFSPEELIPHFHTKVMMDILIKQRRFPVELKKEYERKIFNGIKVNMGSVRYKLFTKKGLKCVKCGIEGSFFALERSVSKKQFKHYTHDPEDFLKQEKFEYEKMKKTSPNIPYNNIDSYHFNLYALKENGHEVLMTKDHIIPKCKGGGLSLSNLQTMCHKCNQKKGDSYGGM